LGAVSKSQLAEVIVQWSSAFRNKNLAHEIAAYLIHERRTGELESIMREVQRIRETQGVVEANVTTAFPASPKIKQHIKMLLGTDNVVLNEIVDKNVIGGVRVETSDTYLDLTVRNRLERFKNMTQGVQK
jgi:F0F1-type ATP synthase delta subunit